MGEGIRSAILSHQIAKNNYVMSLEVYLWMIHQELWNVNHLMHWIETIFVNMILYNMKYYLTDANKNQHVRNLKKEKKNKKKLKVVGKLF